MDGWTIGADVATMLTGLSVVIGGLVGIQLLRPNLDLSLKSEIIHLGEKAPLVSLLLLKTTEDLK